MHHHLSLPSHCSLPSSPITFSTVSHNPLFDCPPPLFFFFFACVALPLRMKLQTTIALSRLVGEELETDAHLRRSLATIVRYAAEDRRGSIGSSFTQQVCFGIGGIWDG